MKDGGTTLGNEVSAKMVSVGRVVQDLRTQNDCLQKALAGQVEDNMTSARVFTAEVETLQDQIAQLRAERDAAQEGMQDFKEQYEGIHATKEEALERVRQLERKLETTEKG